MNRSSHAIEPVFYLGLKKPGQVPAELLPGQLDNYFEFCLKQNPNDLSHHLQRIRAALTRNSKSTLFAALCDLFIILGKLGLPLRQRLMQLSNKTLALEQQQFLLSHMDNEALNGSETALPDNCLFKQQASSELFHIEEPGNGQAQETEDVMRTADSYIENSQFDAARHYMASHLEQDPDNEELTMKLIALYKALNNTEEFQKAYDQFANNLLTAQHWDQAKAYFTEQ